MLTPSAAEFAKRSLFELERLPRAVLFIDLVESVRLISIAEDSTETDGCRIATPI